MPKFYVAKAHFHVLNGTKIEAYESELEKIAPWDSHYVGYVDDVKIYWFDTAAARDRMIDRFKKEAIDYGIRKVNEVRKKFGMKKINDEEFKVWAEKLKSGRTTVL
jgi:hypothetical protein